MRVRDLVRIVLREPDLQAVVDTQALIIAQQQHCLDDLHGKHVQMQALMARMNLALQVLQSELDNAGGSADVRALLAFQPVIH